jgi:aminopeptidase N
MRTEQPVEIRRIDYTAPAHKVDRIALTFDLAPTSTRVTAKIAFQPWTPADAGKPLRLDGEDLKLINIAINGETLDADAYVIDAQGMTVLAPPPQPFTLETEVEIAPEGNMRLEGLYRSNGIYCTQCEAEGFRRITYFPDRPDVMASYEVEIRADKADVPILLSNGDLIAEGPLEDGRHFARWQDPHRKPCYLFALVAGDLAKLTDQFTTASGAAVDLLIWTEHGQEAKAAYAMDALKRSMVWDEENYGLEYDLGQFNIVAISDFNMGAMENKSLNVFNAKYILADSDTATDNDYAFIEGVVAHEYFHNWTGNRVTCRDWFQLSLKEGLTVFRDQQFSADARSAAEKRIDDVKRLRARQFPEDAGPMAHPIRPEAYIEINNFYTPTIYEKGAEVIGMLRRLIGPETYRKGIDLYFERHDGTAATCDDFVDAMADASGYDLSRFRRWYGQAGTPVVTVSHSFEDGVLSLTLRQLTPPTPGQVTKDPVEMPIEIGLIGDNGRDVVSELLVLAEAEQTWRFDGLAKEPALSINRGFTAPVRIVQNETAATLSFRMANDSDAFNRWEAGQSFASDVLLEMVTDIQAGVAPTADKGFVEAWGQALVDPNIDPAFRALLMTSPSADAIAGAMTIVDVEAIHQAKQALRGALARAHTLALETIWSKQATVGEFSASAAAAGLRAERGAALSYLSCLDGGAARATEAAAAADNMTDRMAALGALNDKPGPERDLALANFRERYADNPNVLDKWLALIAMAPIPSVLDDVRRTMQDPAFTLTNPNRARALIGVFAGFNPVGFHARDGCGYAFLAEQILALDKLNPQTAARMMAPLGRWKRMDPSRQALMKAALKTILSDSALSPDVFEIADKSLKA